MADISEQLTDHHLKSDPKTVWFDLSQIEEICQVTGPDRVRFLNAYTTQNILQLSEGIPLPGAFLNQKGKLITNAEILSSKDRILLLLPKGYAEKLTAHLNTFLMFSESKLKTVTSDYFHLAVLGENARDHWKQIFPEGIPEGQAWETKRWGMPAIECIGSQAIASTVFSSLKDFTPVSTSWMEALRVKAGIPKMGVDMDEENLVAEVGLDETATSFNKGCYLGQETTARVHSMGRVNHKLARFQLSRSPERSLPLEIFQEEKTVGRLSSWTLRQSDALPIGLGLLHRQALEKPEGLYIRENGSSIALKVL